MKKRFISVVLLVIISSISNIFATSISDNDGSAFITKAEFDALKSQFQAQIDTYNQGIDSKIDNAIASYLSGVKTNVDPIDYIEKINNTAGGLAWFKNEVPSTKLGSSTVVAKVAVASTRHLTIDDLKPQFYGFLVKGEWGGTEWCEYGDIQYLKITAFQTKMADDKDSGNMFFWNADLFTKHGSWGNSYKWLQCSDSLPNVSYGILGDPASVLQKVTNNYTSITNTPEITPSGQRWIYSTDLNGKKYLSKFDTEVYPAVEIDVWVHRYKSIRTNTTWANAHFKNNGLDYIDASALTIDTTSKIKTFGRVTSGTKYGDGSTSEGDYYEGMISKIETDDGIKYESMNWGKAASTEVYANGDTEALDISGAKKTISVPQSEFSDMYYTQFGKLRQTNKQSGYTVKYNNFTFTNNKYKLSDFLYNPATSIYGDDVYIGNGIPMFKSVSDLNKLTLKIKFKTSNSSYNNITFDISDKPFNKNVVDSSSYHISDTATAGVEKTVVLNNIKKDDVFWINFYNNTLGYDAAIESVTYDITN